jgi:hypothetical protein
VPKFGRGIRIGHVNIRDLMSKSKLNDIKVLLGRDNYDIFMISETWLWNTISDLEINIEGYKMIRCDRPNIKTYNKRGGGVIVYIKNEYEVELKDHNFTSAEKVQAIKFNIKRQHVKSITFIAINRVSDTPQSFLKEIEEEMCNSQNELYVIGDLNIDQLKVNDLYPIIRKAGMKQLIKEPTRVTDSSKTLIDLIITNSSKSDYHTSGVTRNALSDHDIIYSVRKQKKQFKKNVEVREVRNFKNIDEEKVKDMINNAPWWALQMSNDVDRMFDIYCEIIKIIMNKCIPLKKLRVVTTKPIWMTKKYSEIMNHANKLKATAVKEDTPETWNDFKKQRN